MVTQLQLNFYAFNFNGLCRFLCLVGLQSTERGFAEYRTWVCRVPNVGLQSTERWKRGVEFAKYRRYYVVCKVSKIPHKGVPAANSAKFTVSGISYATP